MFWRLSIILSTGGVSASVQTPPWADIPLGRYPPWQTPHWTDTRQTTPPRQKPPPLADTPQATAADGTHPTGMHSCFLLCPPWSLSLSWSWSCAVCISYNGLVTLHGIGTCTGNKGRTIGNNGPWSLVLSWTSVNISTCSRSRSRAVWTCHKYVDEGRNINLKFKSSK